MNYDGWKKEIFITGVFLKTAKDLSDVKKEFVFQAQQALRELYEHARNMGLTERNL